MAKLDLSQNAKTYTLIAADCSLADAIKLLRLSNEKFAIIGDEQHPQTLLSENRLLEALINPQDKPLCDILDKLPPLITVDIEVGSLDTNDLSEFAHILQETRAPGIVIIKDGKVDGVIPREAIAQALPVSSLIKSARRALHGDPSTSTRAYRCDTCGARRRPRQAFKDPVCPINPQHGTMSKV